MFVVSCVDVLIQIPMQFNLSQLARVNGAKKDVQTIRCMQSCTLDMRVLEARRLTSLDSDLWPCTVLHL